MRAIFISYRRDDTEGHAGRLFEDLCDRFGKDAVFMDVTGIEPGRDFRRAIEQQVASCGVLLAIIGKNWLTVADAKGKRRLDDPFDFVRLETAGALKRDIPVIPVLVHQAEMPRAEDLPEDLKDLAYRNGVELNHARWASDVQLLISALMPHVDIAPAVPVPTPPPAPALARPVASGTVAERRSPAWLIAPLGVIAAGGIAYVAWDRLSSPSPSPLPSPDVPVVAASAPVLASSVSPVARVPVASAVAPAPAPALVIAPAPITAPAAPASTDTTTVAAASAPVPHPIAVVPAPKPHRTDAPVAIRSPSPSPAARPAPAAPTYPSAAPAAIVQPAPAPIARAPSSPPAAAPETVAAPREAAASDLYGAPGAGSMPARTIAISPDTKFVNVTGGETIRFQVGGRSFVWTFNGTRSSFDLARVAPAAMLDHKVTTYVAADPMHPKK